MAAVWRWVKIASIVLSTVCLAVLLMLLRSNDDTYTEIEFQYYGNAENSELSNSKINEVSYTIIKRSADNAYPKKATTVDEKKHPKKSIIHLTNSNGKPDVSSKAWTSPDEGEPILGPTFPPNTSTTPEEHYHIYYNSTFYKSAEQALPFLVDFQKLPEQNITVNKLLSDSYRKASTVQLSFDFPFYGHLLRNITIATGGFLYMEEYVHSWLAATQYVAPLMANFDTSLKNESMVRYFDNGTAFTVQWHKVLLQDRGNDGPFTFQVTLMKNGKIIFVYEEIPLSVVDIANHSHPVKVGISDAYTIDRTIYYIRRKTIYEYNRIEMKRDEIGNFTAIVFTALPTCLSFNDCQSCISSDIGFDCIWCDRVKRCSDGLDRYRQEWLKQDCDRKKEKIKCSNGSNSTETFPHIEITNITNHITEKYNTEYTQSPIKPNVTSPPDRESTPEPSNTFLGPSGRDWSSSARVEEKEAVSMGGVVAIVATSGLIIGMAAWLLYAYRHPQTPSGQFLIKYRPSRWHFRHGEARYTAASIHM